VPVRMTIMMTALVLMAHGSRHVAANDDLVALADGIRTLGRYGFVVASYLELAAPDIKTACKHCIAAGATKVILLPYFLSAGIHMRRDLTRIREDLASQYPNVLFHLAEPLGRHALLQEIVLQRAEEASGAIPFASGQKVIH
jgi:sirohydrochlorin ferrochelatase